MTRTNKQDGADLETHFIAKVDIILRPNAPTGSKYPPNCKKT